MLAGLVNKPRLTSPQRLPPRTFSLLHEKLTDRQSIGKMSLTDSSPARIANAASVSSRNLAILPRADRNDALDAIHQSLLQAKESILIANARDLSLATKAAEDGQLSQSVLKRLDLGRPGKWEDMLQGILDVRDLEDPRGPLPSLFNHCGKILTKRTVGSMKVLYHSKAECDP